MISASEKLDGSAAMWEGIPARRECPDQPKEGGRLARLPAFLRVEFITLGVMNFPEIKRNTASVGAAGLGRMVLSQEVGQ